VLYASAVVFLRLEAAVLYTFFIQFGGTV